MGVGHANAGGFRLYGAGRWLCRVVWLLAGIAMLFTMAVGASGCAASSTGAAPDVALDLEDVPDEAFRSYLAEHVDEDDDGLVSKAEASAVTAIGDALSAIGEDNGLYGLGIADLTGIEAFPNLETLVCANNDLTEIDVSQNTALVYLVCSQDNLVSLDLSRNAALVQVDCSDNQLDTIDLSQNGQLEELSCDDNELMLLDVSDNEELASVLCSGNEELDTLTLPATETLEVVQATDCGLVSVDLSQTPNVADVELDDSVEVVGAPFEADDELAENTALLAGTYVLAGQTDYGEPFEGVVGKPGSSVDIDYQLVYQTIYSTWNIACGEMGAIVPDDPFGLAASDSGKYTLTDESVKTILASYYGYAPDDISYIGESSDGGIVSNGDGTWTLWTADGPFACTVQTANYEAWGSNLSYDMAVFQAVGLNEYHLHYYHVVARQNDESIFGYSLESIAPAGDLGDSFPSLAEDYEELAAGY